MFPRDYVCGKVLNACAKNGYFNDHLVPIYLPKAQNSLKKAHGLFKGPPTWGMPVDNTMNQFLVKFYPNLI